MDVVVVGGGLSGLVATWRLQEAGVAVTLLEARPRLGGRILTVAGSTADGDAGTFCDLGPSWFWPGQPLVADLLRQFQIPHYEQFAAGESLYQDADGRVMRSPGPSPMFGARRMVGGMERLTDAIASRLDASRVLTEHPVVAVALEDDAVTLFAERPSGEVRLRAQRVALALPPRLAAALKFTPDLSRETRQRLVAMPTWMAGHAKFFALYDEPFWRQRGLSGSAFSRRGPLSEIHDASPNSGDTAAIFGFCSLVAEARAALGKSALIQRAVDQLVAIFGPAARRPTASFLQDWSAERFTAVEADRQPLGNHPHYGLDLQLTSAWRHRLNFISTETSFANGGLIEGAIEAGLRFARSV